ncbi:nuclear receptor subfamily 2 group E member 1 isoform X2 [Cylas formicarius]|uniref:nuclear receptor subfamily 2 group E member 1 isoform X2 n=1 Tax=Cylas formicarius TaxID=197179 RepID=UPI002958C59E|nr:nuclear receptor subfamily 2 group E member 1 isoform X2 [Cylas formicarius]
MCRILDIPCKVCGDYSSGKHYNIFACDGCAGFFKRSIRRNRQYICKGKEEGSCTIDKAHRNQCRACRLQKCQEAGMNKDAVQHERGPRNSTLRRVMTSFFENHQRSSNAPGPSPLVPAGTALNLAMSKGPSSQDAMYQSMAVAPAVPPAFLCHGLMMPRVPSLAHFPPPVISPPLTPPPTLVTPEAICESAARLLFMNVQWTKSLDAFTALSLPDQLLLLEEGWKELFILGAAQVLPPTDLASLARGSEDHTIFLRKLRDFQEVLADVRHFQMDHQEFACLRVVALFKTPPPTTTCKSLEEVTRVQAVQNDAQLALSKYLGTAKPQQPLRFGKLLLLLSGVRNVPADTIEELFFKKTIGDIPIVKIICDMYKSQR